MNVLSVLSAFSKEMMSMFLTILDDVLFAQVHYEEISSEQCNTPQLGRACNIKMFRTFLDFQSSWGMVN